MSTPGVLTALVLLFLFASPQTCRAAHNITSILASRRDLAEFSRQLTSTGLADDIDARNTITVLAVDDAHMSALKARGLHREALRRVLSLHVLVDYYEDAKLRRLPGGYAVVSTLFQASGDAPGSSGMVKISDRRGGRVAFLPQQQDEEAADNDGAQVFYVKSVHVTPYNISVLQVSAVMSSQAAEAPSLPESARPNATDVMARNGCGRFASLAASAGAASRYEKTMANDGGLTLFCPGDKAVKAFMPAYGALSRDARLALLLYHGVARHYSLPALKALGGAMRTLAMDAGNDNDNDDDKYVLTAREDGSTVRLLSAAKKPATVTGKLMDADPLAVYIVDAVLMPTDGSSPGSFDGTGDGAGDAAAAAAKKSAAATCRLSFVLLLLLGAMQVAALV